MLHLFSEDAIAHCEGATLQRFFSFLPLVPCEPLLTCSAFQSDCTSRRLNPTSNPNPPRLIGRRDRGPPSAGFSTAARTECANVAVACLQPPPRTTASTPTGASAPWSTRPCLPQRQQTALDCDRVLNMAAVRCARPASRQVSSMTESSPCSVSDGPICTPKQTRARCATTTTTRRQCCRWR